MVDRESARSLAQKKRQMESIIAKPPNPFQGPMFSEPVKTDKVDNQMQNILGSFSTIKNVVMEPNSMNNLLGIPKEPQTPVDANKFRPLFETTRPTFTPNGQVKSSKSGSQSTSGLTKELLGSSSSKSSSQYLKNGQKSKEAAKPNIKQEPQLSKSRPSGASYSPQVAPCRGTSSPATVKSQKPKDGDTRFNIKKEKDTHDFKPSDTGTSSTTNSTKVKPSSGVLNDSNCKPLLKKNSTPVKSRTPPKSDVKPTVSTLKKDFQRPNGIVSNHQFMHTGHAATDSKKQSETITAAVKQEPHFIKQEPTDYSTEVKEEPGAGHLSVVTKKLFGDPPDSTSERKPDIKKEKLNVPKLNIPSTMGSINDPSNQEVEKILNMMTEIKSPLTAIQNTPIKEDASCRFPFLSTPVSKTAESKQSLQVPPAVKPSAVKLEQDVKVEPTSPIREGSSPEKKPTEKAELADDLAITDDSDTEEPRTAKEDSGEQHSLRHSGNMDAIRLSDSSSASSSGESDDDSSSGNDTDSESDASSSDHESLPPSSPPEKTSYKSYNLHDLINKKINEGHKSPGALSASKQPPHGSAPATTSAATTPPALAIKETQSFPNTNQHRSTVMGGRRVEGSGGFVIGINDLTTTLTPPEDYDKGSFSKYNDNSMNDFNKLSMSNERRTPLPKSPVRTGGSGSKQNVSKRGPKKMSEKSPSVGKSKVNSQVRNDLPLKESKKDTKGAKLTKQSSKSGAEPKAEVKVKSSKTGPRGEKKTPPRSRTPEKKSMKKPVSKEFVSDTDSSGSEDEVERTWSSKTVNGASNSHMLSPTHKSSARTEIKCKASSKGNRTKEKHNSVKTEKETSLASPVLDAVFKSMIGPPGVGPLSEPLLSPIKTEDLERPVLIPHQPLYKDGIPSLIVKLKLSLINRVPGRPREPCRTGRTSPEHSCSASETSFKSELLEFEEDRPPPLVKDSSKRKQEDLEDENPVKESGSKKPKNESNVKALRTVASEEPEHNELSFLPDSDTVLDRRRPPERRGSTNSVSSLLSSQSSSSSRRSDRDSQPNKRRKKTNDSMDSSCSSNTSSSSSSSSSGTNFLNAPSNSSVPVMKGHEWGSPPPPAEERVDRSQDSMSVSNDVTCTRNGHRSVSEEWGDVSSGVDFVKNSNPHTVKKNTVMSEKQRLGLEFEDRQFTADSYLAEGKKLKRQADAQNDKNVKALMYFDAVLSFILCGNSMENDPLVPDEKASTMYADTCDIIKFILKFKGSHLNPDALSMDKKLAVLCHRCQGLLYMKMFKMKKAAGMKLARMLGEHFKNSSKSQQAAQAPSPWSSSKHPDLRCKPPMLRQLTSPNPSSPPSPRTRYTGTPSPMSPTPSPAGSVGSVGSLGSQGSNNGDASGNNLQPSSLPQVQPNKLTNGVPHIMSSPANVSVPQRIVNMMSTFIQNSNYGYYSLDFWEQADVLAQENIEFFQDLDREFGHLTLQSSTLDLVRYARLGLRKLKNSWVCPSPRPSWPPGGHVQ